MKKYEYILVALAILGLVLIIATTLSICVDRKPYDARVEVIHRNQPELRGRHNLLYPMSVVNLNMNREEVIYPEYFLWEYATPGQLMDLTLYHEIPSFPTIRKIVPPEPILMVVGLVIIIASGLTSVILKDYYSR